MAGNGRGEQVDQKLQQIRPKRNEPRDLRDGNMEVPLAESNIACICCMGNSGCALNKASLFYFVALMSKWSWGSVESNLHGRERTRSCQNCCL